MGGLVGCGWLGVIGCGGGKCGVGVVVGVRKWVGKVVGHEVCEHELETRETVNLVAGL